MANGWQMIKEARSAMGCSRKRVGKNGKIRYNACYRDLRGTVLSAGTFATEKASDRAWQKAEVVKERLGHASIVTTQRYLHTLPDADETAVEAFTQIRNRRRKPGDQRPRRSA